MKHFAKLIDWIYIRLCVLLTIRNSKDVSHVKSSVLYYILREYVMFYTEPNRLSTQGVDVRWQGFSYPNSNSRDGDDWLSKHRNLSMARCNIDDQY